MALGQLVVRLGLDAAEFTQGMSKAEAEAYKYGETIGVGLKNAAIGAAAGLAAIGAAATVAWKAFDAQVELIANFKNLSEKIGDTAENLASLKKASDVSGVSMDSIATASIKLTAALSKTDEEGMGAANAIKALGLDFDKFKALSPVDQIEAVSKAMAGFEDGAGKTAVAVALWGKSGAAMIPLLNDLAEGSQRQITLTQDQIKAADDFSKAMARLSSDTSTLKQQLAAQLIPTLQDLLTTFTGSGDESEKASGKLKLFSEWMEVLRQKTKETINGFLSFGSVVSQTTTFIGGYIDVSKALLSGSLSDAKAVGSATRDEMDKTSARFKKLQSEVSQAGESSRGKGFSDPRLLGASDAKPKLAYDGVKPKTEKTGGAEKQSEADKYLASLQKQLEATDKLTVSAALMRDIELGRLGVVTPAMQSQLLLIAQQIDAVKAKEVAEKSAAEAQKVQWDLERKSILENMKGEADRAAQGESLRQSVMTDMEQIIALEKTYAAALTNNNISLETYGRLMDALQVRVDALNPAFLDFKATAMDAANSLADGLADAIVQGKSLADVFKNVVKQLAVMILKAILFRAISGFVQSITGFDLSGAKAGGGNVNQNSTYLVGEKGPELFTPSQSGRITTNAQTFKESNGGGGGQTNVYNISAGGVSREEFTSGLNRTQAGAVSDVRQNRLRRRA
jgi:hypothetical protein